MFDVAKLANFAQNAIMNFAAAHQDETFYAFCITGSLLSLNSEEEFTKRLTYYRQKFPGNYEDDERAERLKENSGDWSYQGFAEFGEANGFDPALDEVHYNLHLPLPEGQTVTTEYSLAMDAVLHLLVQRDAFEPLKRTDDFSMSRMDYD